MNSILFVVLITSIVSASDCEIVQDMVRKVHILPLLKVANIAKKCCTATGVQCKNNRVTSITFRQPDNYVSTDPTISDLIAGLDQLESLSLEGFGIPGEISPSLGCLKKLTRLSLARNNFSGPVPDTFRDLKDLQELDLSSNKLSGNLSPLLTGMASLQMLKLGDNKLSGPIPSLQISTTCDLHNNDALCLDKSLSNGLSSICGAFPRCDEKPVINFNEDGKTSTSNGMKLIVFPFCLIFTLIVFISIN